RSDLLYYDWEITQNRLLQWKYVFQANSMAHIENGLSELSIKWIDEISRHLGNTATELTMISPNELKLVRKSHIGLAGLELVALARWIDSPAFPLDYKRPPSMRPKTMKK